MIPVNDLPASDEPDVVVLAEFDRALAAGAEPVFSGGALPRLEPVHECQRLLEAIWPRNVPPPRGLPIGFGRFSILHELGRGGFGIVFLAEDSALGRQVALKVPRPDVLITPDVRRRFLREAEAASRLDHPHIVPVYEVGEEGPICYIASAYCEGPTLAQWLRRQTGAVPVRVAGRLVAVLAEAVAHAHERSILHRDLKPGNILLQERNGNSSSRDRLCDELGAIPRICDFGLAKLLDQATQETRTGVPIGSAEYMAPEQAAGRLREHGPATDVYALGVILYELLTGRPPHRGETDLETLRLVSDEDPPSPRSLRPGLPRDLETITLKCLEKPPAGRYASASELAADLQRFVDGNPVLTRPVPAWAHAGKWARRRPAHASLAVLLAICAVALPAGLEWSRVREKRHGAELRKALERSRQSEEEARAQRALANREHLAAYQHLAANQLKLAGSLAERGEYESVIGILDTLAPRRDVPGTRGFAWNYLDRLVRPRAPMLPGLPETARAAAVVGNGRMIALTDDVNSTFLLDRDTGKLRKLAATHKLLRCERLLFSPGGRILASLSHGLVREDWGKSEIKVWDVASGDLIKGMAQEFAYCYEMVFSPDGQTLITVEAVSGNRGAPVRCWRVQGDRKQLILSESVRADELAARLDPARPAADAGSQPFRLTDILAVIPDKPLTMAITRENGEIRIYNSRSGYCKALCRRNGPEIVFVPRVDLANPCPPAEVELIGRLACALTNSARARPLCATIPILRARFSRDGRAVAVLQHHWDRPRGALRLIDVETGRVDVESMWGDVPEQCQFEFTPTGDSLIVTGFDSRPRIWDFHGWRAPGILSGHRKEVWGLEFSPDGRMLASSSDDGTVKLWNMASGSEQKTLTGHGSLVMAVAYSPDGQLLASAGWDKSIRLWSTSSGAEIATLLGHTDHVRSVAFSPDGRTLASAGNDGAIRLWDVASARALGPPLTGHTNWVFSIAFARDGKTLYSGSLDKSIRLWDWKEGRLQAAWRAADEVLSLALAPDGRTLAVAHARGTIRLWDTVQEQARQSLQGHVGHVLGMAFSPDGHTLASAGRDQTVRLWDPDSGHELLTLRGHGAAVHAIALSPDGATLASGSHDGAIKLWRTSFNTADPAPQVSSRKPSKPQD